MQPVFHWIKTRSEQNFGQNPVCSIPKHTSASCLGEAAFTWSTVCKEAKAGGVAELLHETVQKLLLALLPRFSGQMDLPGKEGSEGSQESLCHFVQPCFPARDVTAVLSHP